LIHGCFSFQFSVGSACGEAHRRACQGSFAQRDPEVTIDMRMRDYHIAVVGATRLRTATAWREGPNNIQGLSNMP